MEKNLLFNSSCIALKYIGLFKNFLFFSPSTQIQYNKHFIKNKINFYIFKLRLVKRKGKQFYLYKINGHNNHIMNKTWILNVFPIYNRGKLCGNCQVFLDIFFFPQSIYKQSTTKSVRFSYWLSPHVEFKLSFLVYMTTIWLWSWCHNILSLSPRGS